MPGKGGIQLGNFTPFACMSNHYEFFKLEKAIEEYKRMIFRKDIKANFTLMQLIFVLSIVVRMNTTERLIIHNMHYIFK